MNTPNAVRSLLVALVVALQLITLVTLTSSTKKRLQEQFEANAHNSISNKADAVEEQVRLFMRTIEAQLVSVKAHIEDGLVDIEDDAQLSISFRSQLGANRWLKSAFVGRPDGSFVRVSQSLDGERYRTKVVSIKDGERTVLHHLRNTSNRHSAQWLENDDPYDPRERQWYTLAQKTLTVAWSDPFRLYSNGQLGVTASTQLTHFDLEKLGVLSFSVDLQQITAFLQAALSDSSGSAIILNDQGTVVASTGDDLFTDRSDGANVPSFHQLSGQTLRDLASTLVLENHVANSEKSRQSANHETPRYGQSIGLTRPLDIQSQTLQWQLVVLLPMTDFAGKMESFIDQSLAALMAMIAVSGVLALLFVVRVTAPVYQMYHRATVDQLTNAMNRSEYEHRLQQLLTVHEDRIEQRKTDSLVCVVMDLDGFKQINDIHGHAAGDFVLSTVVKRLKAKAGKSALIGRLGGDEFAIAVYIPGNIDIVGWVESLRAQVVDKPATRRSASYSFGMTCGISVAQHRDTLTDLIKRADEALVRGKLLEKNRCYVSTNPAESEHASHIPSQKFAAAA